MARINLLPWRAERRKQRQKGFMSMLGLSALAGIALWFLVNTYYNNQIDGQNARNAYLQEQIVKLDAQIKEIEELDKQKARLLARKQVIEELQSNRSQMVHLFDSLVRTIPDGVVLTSIKQEGDKLTLEGRSQSNARVSTYMRTLESSGWMSKPELSVIEAQGAVKGLPYVFTLSVTLANPNAAKDENGDGVPDTAPPADPNAPATTPATATPPASTTPPANTPTAPASTPTPTTAPAAPATPATTTPAAPAKPAPAKTTEGAAS